MIREIVSGKGRFRESVPSGTAPIAFSEGGVLPQPRAQEASTEACSSVAIQSDGKRFSAAKAIGAKDAADPGMGLTTSVQPEPQFYNVLVLLRRCGRVQLKVETS